MRISIFMFIVLLVSGCATAPNNTAGNANIKTSSLSCSSGLECQNIGLKYVSQGEESSYKIARGYFYKSCNYYGMSEGCNNLAFLHANARGGKQSYVLAYKYWGMACRMGNQLGCSNLEFAKDLVAAIKK